MDFRPGDVVRRKPFPKIDKKGLSPIAQKGHWPGLDGRGAEYFVVKVGDTAVVEEVQGPVLYIVGSGWSLCASTFELVRRGES